MGGGSTDDWTDESAKVPEGVVAQATDPGRRLRKSRGEDGVVFGAAIQLVSRPQPQ